MNLGSTHYQRRAPPRFTIDDENPIAAGTFGEVFLATLTDTTPVVVKRAKQSWDTSLAVEFDLLEQLKDKEAIVQTFGYQHTGLYREIVLERADGALEHLLNLPRHSLGLPMQIILDLIGDLGKALTALAQAKIVHRDIKPQNILYFIDHQSDRIEGRYICKLCDFGVGRNVENMKVDFETVQGSHPYMAPQVLANSQRLVNKYKMTAEKSDLWSLGITLYRCVTGRLPFYAPTTHQLLDLLKGRQMLKNDKIIAYQDGKYEEELLSDIHPRWFLDMLTPIIQLILGQRHSREIYFGMALLSQLRSRVVFNTRINKFYINHPHLNEEDNLWKWKLTPAQVGIEHAGRVCVLNEGKDVRFFEPSWEETKLYQLNTKFDRKIRDVSAPFSVINNLPGMFLIACERELDRVHGSVKVESLEELRKRMEAKFANLSDKVFAAITFSELIALQELIENIRQISRLIDNQRTEAIRRLKESLNNRLIQTRMDDRLRNYANDTFVNRRPDLFQMTEVLERATLTVDIVKN